MPGLRRSQTSKRSAIVLDPSKRFTSYAARFARGVLDAVLGRAERTAGQATSAADGLRRGENRKPERPRRGRTRAS